MEGRPSSLFSPPPLIFITTFPQWLSLLPQSLLFLPHHIFHRRAHILVKFPPSGTKPQSPPRGCGTGLSFLLSLFLFPLFFFLRLILRKSEPRPRRVIEDSFFPIFSGVCRYENMPFRWRAIDSVHNCLNFLPLLLSHFPSSTRLFLMERRGRFRLKANVSVPVVVLLKAPQEVASHRRAPS